MTRCPYCHRPHATRRVGPISIALCTTATTPADPQEATQC